MRRILLAAALSLASFALMLPSAVQAQQAKLNLKYIPDDAVAVVVARPRALLTQPSMEMMPLEVITAAGLQQTGIDPLDIEQFILVLGQPSLNTPPDAGIIVRLAKPYDWKAISEKVKAAAAEFGFTAGGMADPKTLVMAQPGLVESMRASDGTGDGSLLKVLRTVDDQPHVQTIVSLDAARVVVDQMVEQIPELPPPMDQFAKAPGLTSNIQIAVSYGTTVDVKVLLTGRDEAAAEELERLLKMGLLLGKQALLSNLSQDMPNFDPNDPVQAAMQRYLRRMIDTLFAKLEPAREAHRVAIHVNADVGLATTSVAVGLLLPAVQAARAAARRAQTNNNLKMIALAMHNYHDAYRGFPDPAIRDKDGKPLLSWRVAILPFIEQQQLYEKFRLDEPWDSDHNRALIDQMPAVFNNPELAVKGKTNYLLVTGKGTGFEKPKTTIAQIIDGTSNTIMAVEADASQAVEWTKPADWEFDSDNPLRGLGKFRPGIFLAAFFDGSVQSLSNTIDPNQLRALMTSQGGEVIDRR